MKVVWLAAAVALALGSGPVRAVTIEVLSAGAVEPGLLPAAEAFRRETGHEAKVRFATAPFLRQRLDGVGERPDVAIAPPAILDEATALGRIDPAFRVVVGKVGVGVAVRDGAPQPDVRTVEALKRAVLDADSVVYNRASTGLYLETLFGRLGLTDQIAGKSTRYPDGASVMEHLVRGSTREIGFGALTEILLFRDKGVKLVGPLPPEVQNYTTYAAAPVAGTANGAAAVAFVRFLGSPAGRAIFAARGIE
ncbi:MAG TPA: substrate-binding domain-containing protein [Beijerinckiaceae bacterium]